ncbi:hypothetical protein D1632_12610 [Chryseobacterium nematophagum]|uniref:Endonuclease GajA/Old nuclease/RecF-like AAA domain-containing protein n=1 Tax=Chryseobacterium nematophagum TaxID=2305228 RepID=A0A3M7L8W1_9FLAO|nr:AAA family ATPase [Chryseobacterium nematophagum]RMZ58455.1 hypothetical protein D1632_12610 [Chryseobacterium nematophagum]
MKISSITIKGYKSFGPEGVPLPLQEKLAGFIGLNSAGKTAALEKLRKLFGALLMERKIFRSDFPLISIN